MHNICFSFINSKTTKRRPNLFCIDGCRKLSSFFGPFRKVCKPFKLTKQGNTIFFLTSFTKIFNMVNNQGKIFTIKEQRCSLGCLSFRISSFSSTFSVRISAFNNETSKLFLSICKKFLFWHVLIIVFLPYFFNLKRRKMFAG